MPRKPSEAHYRARRAFREWQARPCIKHSEHNTTLETNCRDPEHPLWLGVRILAIDP